MTLDALAAKLTKKHPEMLLSADKLFYWSPADKTVYYDADNERPEGLWALLHESGHALLQHLRYYSDVELVFMEVDAWEKAKELAAELKMEIDEDHVQDCLDSYRDWLHKRSLCPDCSLSGIQIEASTYSCIFCHMQWRVTAERFCRPYRKVA